MRSSERLVVLGGLGMAVASVVPWYTAESVFDSPRTNGWQEPDAILSQLGTVAAALLAVVVLIGSRQATRPRLGDLSWGVLLTVGGVVSLGLIALKFSLNLERTTVGIYLALAAGVTQLYGGYVTHLETSGSSPSPGGLPTSAATDSAATGSPAPIAQWRPQGQGQWQGWGQAPAVPAVPTPASPTAASPAAAWPETAYFLSAWAARSGTVEAAVAAYRQAFAADPARLQRLAAEVHALLDPAREAERAALVAIHVPVWGTWPTQQVFSQLARALTGRADR